VRENCEEQRSLKVSAAGSSKIAHSAESGKNGIWPDHTIAMCVSTNELKEKLSSHLGCRMSLLSKSRTKRRFLEQAWPDSIDALELVVMLEKHYGIVIKDIEGRRPAFVVRTLAELSRQATVK